jgi:hypothetical protein
MAPALSSASVEHAHAHRSALAKNCIVSELRFSQLNSLISFKITITSELGCMRSGPIAYASWLFETAQALEPALVRQWGVELS